MEWEWVPAVADSVEMEWKAKAAVLVLQECRGRVDRAA